MVHILKEEKIKNVLVFTETKHGADKVTRFLVEKGISAEAIHGNKSQGARQRAIEDFTKDRVRVLVATDIASRGIDIDGITHVINFDLPQTHEDYIHRIGRTGRAASHWTGRTGGRFPTAAACRDQDGRCQYAATSPGPAGAGHARVRGRLRGGLVPWRLRQRRGTRPDRRGSGASHAGSF